MDDPLPPEEVWEPPYSPCDEAGWRCAGAPISDASIELGARGDGLVSDAMARGDDAAELVAALTSEGLSARATGARVLFWAPGGMPRVVVLEGGPEVDAGAQRERYVSVDTLLEPLRRPTSRASGLSVSRGRRGRDRAEKSALVLSPFRSSKGEGSPWATETDEVSAAFDDARGYGLPLIELDDGVSYESFSRFREHDFIFVSTHGGFTQDYDDTRQIVFLMTGKMLHGEELDEKDVYGKADLVASLGKGCQELERQWDGLLPPGIACVWHEASWQPVDSTQRAWPTAFAAVTGEFLAFTENSAPLQDTLLWLSACQTGRGIGKSGYDLFAWKGCSIAGYDKDVNALYAAETTSRYLTPLLERGDDLSFCYDDFDEASKRGPDGAALTILYTSDIPARAIEVVTLLDDLGGEYEAGSPPLLLRESGSGALDTTDVALTLRGVRAEHPKGGLDAHEVALFLADSEGAPRGTPLPPGFVSVASSSAELIDSERGEWRVVLKDLEFPQDMRGKRNETLVAVARLPEGGTSEVTYEVDLRAQDCPFLEVTIDGAPQPVANEVNILKLTEQVSLISFARAEFDSNGQQLERQDAPAGSVTLVGALPDGSSSKTFSATAGAFGTSSISVAFDYEDPMPRIVDVTIESAPGRGQWRGTFTGNADAIDLQTNEERVVTVMGSFLTAPINQTEPDPSCYFYRD